MGVVRQPARPVSGSQSGGFSQGQKAIALAVAVLCGPALLKKVYDKPPEKVDLSMYKIVTSYETPAIEKMDDTLRVEFCQA